MSLDDVPTCPTRRAPLPAGHGIVFDPRRPLRIWSAGELTVSTVSIAWLRERDETTVAELLDRHLSAEEAAYAATLPVPKRRWEWLAGRLAVKHGVRHHHRRRFGTVAAVADITVAPVLGGLLAGKPTVVVATPPVGGGGTSISIAHSADFAVAACAAGEIGIDLERSRELSPVLAGLLSTDDDSRSGSRLAGMPLPLRWACKEAVLKYVGVGLRVDSSEVRLTGWWPDGRFSWVPGPRLRRCAAGIGPGVHSWAREVDGYSLAVVRRPGSTP